MNTSLSTVLHSEGYKVTPARQLVFDLLSSHKALSTKQLRDLTAGQIPASSLYRALEVFRELQMINDVVIGGKRQIELSSRFRPHHHHVSCTTCGMTIDIEDTRLEAYLQQMAGRRGFVHLSHSFEVTGLCPRCATTT